MTFKSFARRRRDEFKSFGDGRREDYRIPDPPAPEEFRTAEDEMVRITRLTGDRGLAQRVVKLQKQYPNGSLPELVVMDWLQRQNLRFHYQVPIAGGRLQAGGAVLDFAVYGPSGLLAWRIQGYYHERTTAQQFDQAQRLILLQTKIGGERIRAVVDLWERRILERSLRYQTLQSALMGLELGR